MMAPVRRNIAWLLLAASGFSLVIAWAIASPVGASPDEPANISYAWGTVTGQTLNGEHLTTIPPGRTATAIRIPQKLLQYPEPACYAFKAQTPVRQCLPIAADNLREVTQRSYMTRYPPLFYGVEGSALRAGTAVGLSGPRVLYGARLTAGVLSLLAIMYGVFLLSRRFPAQVVLLVTLLGLPAMAWFLAASVNPNGLEISAAFLLAAAVLSVRVDLGADITSAGAISAVPLATLLLAWTRPLSWVWASLILGLLLVPIGRRGGVSWIRRLPLRALGATAITATVLALSSSMGWFVYAVQVRSSERGTGGWQGLNPIGRVLVLLLHTGTIVAEQVGTFGWLDTPLPTVAVVAWVAIASVAAAIWTVGRNLLVPRWSLGVIVALGYLVALLDEYRGAWGWQGRYLLPVTAAVCVFAAPGLMNGLERWTVPRHLVPSMLVVLMSVNVLSVVWFLFRNVYGVKDAPGRLPSAPSPFGPESWTPALGQGVVLAFVTLTFALGVTAVWMLRPVTMDAEAAALTGSRETLVLDPGSALRSKPSVESP